MDDEVLVIRELKVEFRTPNGVLRAVDGVSLTARRGRTVALVGESGCGKSATCLTVMGLTRQANARITGEARLLGRNVLAMPARQLRRIRGSEVSMIFQDPMTSLNPTHRIGAQLVEAVRLHQKVTHAQARAIALEGLKEVGIPDASARLDDFPHQFSGGMRQRAMIAMALINSPVVLIADEPTTALDVTTQAQILALLRRLQRQRGMAIIFVTHDLRAVARIGDDVAVMYAGQVVEKCTREQLFSSPRHPYTWALLAAVPRLRGTEHRLPSVPGEPPTLISPPSGCRFHPRCSRRMPVCSVQPPALQPAGGQPNARADACHLDEDAKRSGAQDIAAAAELGSGL